MSGDHGDQRLLVVDEPPDADPPPAPAGGVAVVAGRVVTLSLLGLVIVVGLFGDPGPGANPVPIAVFSWFWFGGLVLALLPGDLWASVNPAVALAELLDRFRRPAATVAWRPGSWWLPGALLLGFAICWVCWPDGTRPRTVAAFVVVWLAVMVAGGLIHGPSWVRSHDPFGLLFSAVAAGVADRVDRASTDTAAGTERATSTVLAVALGATVFDGMRITSGWADLVGSRSLDELAVLNALAMTATIGAIAIGWWGATRRVADAAEGTTAAGAVAVAPLALVLVVDRLATEVDRFPVSVGNGAALASDPFAKGVDLLGTANWIGHPVASPGAVSLVGSLAVLAGHLLAMAVAYDRYRAASWPLIVFLAAALIVAQTLLVA